MAVQMRIREAPAEGGGVVELTPWRERFGVLAGITTRAGSPGAGFGFLTPAPAADVVAAWRAFAAGWGGAFPTLVVGLQIHGRAVAIHDAPPPGWILRDGIDGHVTGTQGVLLAVTVADCIPVYVLHPASGTMGLLHIGWRGAAAGMLEAGIAAVHEVTGDTEGDLVIHCGVGICGDCYEVGPEVLGAVTGGEATAPGRLDLRAQLAERASRCGVGEITCSTWCAAHDASWFYSHRRSHGADGRMVAYLGRPLA
jgi:hypothetical protein